MTPPIRIHPYKAHIIIYRLIGEDVEILRIRHGHENWSTNPLGPPDLNE